LKAVQIHAYGGIEQLRYEETDEPQLQSGNDVIVKLKAAAVNRIDLSLRAGIRSGTVSLPRIVGADGAGMVVSIGSEVRGVKIGDTVCLYPFYACRRCRYCNGGQEQLCGERRLLGECENGTYAEYVRVPAENCVPLPGGFSFEDAAAFSLVYLTAWRMLIAQAELKPGESILIVGAGGGIATAALQVAASVGARIIVTSNHDGKLSAAKNLGAEHGVHSPTGEFAKAVRNLTAKRGVDVVVNCVGGASWRESLASLARGGRLVTCGAVAGTNPKTDLRRVFWNHLRVLAASSATRQEFFQVVNFFAASGRKPIIDQVFPLRDAKWAHRRLEERHQFGKIVLRVDD
jgi:NADPH:quinone reductase-like Zn-dependent oxidoreductase